jgi:two-component system nitrogen regulation response regulator NtrX
LLKIIKQDPIQYLYEMELKSAREEFDKLYLKHHLDNNISMKELSTISGVERTHLYRKLKKLGLKNSK